MNDTFLPPIEAPHGLIMKLAYYFTRRRFGKVLTPLKVHSARLPAAFGLFYGKISKLDKKLTLSPETVMLIREQVARINVCTFCVDIGRSFTIKASMNQVKFDALEQYRASALFTEAERAVLDYVAELTKEKKVNPEKDDHGPNDRKQKKDKPKKEDQGEDDQDENQGQGHQKSAIKALKELAKASKKGGKHK